MTCMRGILIALVVSGMVAGAPAMSQAQAASGNPPTFNEDVAPILFDQCASCHRPGEIAPMPLLSYGDARPWARAIRSKVVAREMPPWGADPHYGEFSNERRLTQKQIDTIAAWADAERPKVRAHRLSYRFFPTPRVGSWSVSRISSSRCRSKSRFRPKGKFRCSFFGTKRPLEQINSSRQLKCGRATGQ